MPYRRKDSPVWWVSFVDASGARVRRSTETTDRREAEALEAKWKLESHQQRKWGTAPSRSFEDVMVEYLSAAARRLRPWGYRRNTDAALHLRAYFEGADMTNLGAQRVRGYVEQRQDAGVSGDTIARELSVLSAAINYCRTELEWELPNPVERRKPKPTDARIRWITRAEADRLIANSPQHLAEFIRLALHTGCRKQELLGLEWARMDLHAKQFYLHAGHTKTGKRRTVPLNREAYAVIIARARFRAEHCPGSPWVFAHKDGERLSDVKRSFATACRKAGITDFRIHDLRHTCAAWLVSAGVSLAEVRDLLGHSTIRMTEKYAHLAPENVRAAVAVLEDRGHDSVTQGEEDKKKPPVGAAKSLKAM